MFGLFGKKKENPMLEYIRNQDATIERETHEYAAAVPLDVEPSVPGNKVIFDAPELESIIGSILMMKTGSVELTGNRKIFKNDKGQIHRVEIFETSIPIRLCYE